MIRNYCSQLTTWMIKCPVGKSVIIDQLCSTLHTTVSGCQHQRGTVTKNTECAAQHVHGRQRQVGLRVWGQPGLHSEFQDSCFYIGQRLGFLYHCGKSQQPGILLSGDLIPSADFCVHQALTWCTFRPILNTEKQVFSFKEYLIQLRDIIQFFYFLE